MRWRCSRRVVFHGADRAPCYWAVGGRSPPVPAESRDRLRRPPTAPRRVSRVAGLRPAASAPAASPARVGGRDLDRVDVLHFGADGLVGEFTVMVRPYWQHPLTRADGGPLPAPDSPVGAGTHPATSRDSRQAPGPTGIERADRRPRDGPRAERDGAGAGSLTPTARPGRRQAPRALPASGLP